MMRIAHATDIHWFVPPNLSDLWSFKRSLGIANLYLRGRKDHFPEKVQADLVARIAELAPDMVVITGDLTATALRAEFAKARAALEPLLSTFPTLVIPGNHDVYTRGAQGERRIRKFFEPWMHLVGPLGRLDLDDLTVLGLDPNRANLVVASGELPREQLDALATQLADPALRDRSVLLAIHYPLLDRNGQIYDRAEHGLTNARELVAVLDRAPKRPLAILHGHEHHGFRVPLPLADGSSIPIFNCGSSGYAYRPDRRRAAAFNVYTVAEGGIVVDRYLYGPDGFAPEPGGAYATGR
jgi:3',5'-cyclic AMP phosphodiesterase CpdA